MACAYCVAIMLICLNVFLIFMAGSLSFVFKFIVDGMCVVTLAQLRPQVGLRFIFLS